MAYEIEWEQSGARWRGVRRRFFGQTSEAEVVRSVSETGSDPRFDDLCYIINDFSACDNVAYTKEGAELLSALGVLSEMANPNFKVAIVGDAPIAGRFAESYLSAALNTIPTRIFATLGEARAWLATPNA
jgi:hypothetical protein